MGLLLAPERAHAVLAAQISKGEALCAQPTISRRESTHWQTTTHGFLVACFGTESNHAFKFGLATVSFDRTDGTLEFREQMRRGIGLLQSLREQVELLHDVSERRSATGRSEEFTAEERHRQELRGHRDRLASLHAPKSDDEWAPFERWASTVRPLVRDRFPAHSDEFESVTVAPAWITAPQRTPFNKIEPPYMMGARARENDERIENNKRLGAEAFTRILATIDKMLRANPTQVEAVEKTMSTIKIFVSHAQPDHVIAKAFAHMIEGAIVVPDGVIRCTSVDGYKLSPGDHGSERLRADIEGCAVLVGLLTNTSIASGYVVMELGAAWGLRKMTCAVLAPEVAFNRIPGPLVERHAIRWDRAADLALLVDAIASATSFQRRGTDRQRVAIDDFLAAISSIPNTKATTAPAAPRSTSEVTEGEASILLMAWINAPSMPYGKAVRFSSVDAELSIPPGTAQRVLPGVVKFLGNWSINASGDVFILTTFDPDEPEF